MNLTAIQAECLKMMEEAPFVDLTTIDVNGFPSTRAMMNLRNKHLYSYLSSLYEAEKNPLTVYMSTNTGSEKIKEIALNGKACLYFCESDLFHGILLQGFVERVTDKEIRNKIWQDDWEVYYPNGGENYSVLRFVPEKLKAYWNNQIMSEMIN